MRHIFLITYFVIFNLGLFAIFSSLVFKTRLKQERVLNFTLYLVLLLLYSVMSFTSLYMVLFKPLHATAIQNIYDWVFTFWLVISCVAIPHLTRRFFGIVPGWFSGILWPLMCLALLALRIYGQLGLTFFGIGHFRALVTGISTVFFVLSLGISLFRVGGEMAREKELSIRHSLQKYFWVTLAFLPVFILDFLCEWMITTGFPFSGIRFGVLYFLVLSFLTVRFTGRLLMNCDRNHTDRCSQFASKYQLTDREKEVLELLVAGLETREISDKLFLSPDTVRNYIHKINQKTGTRNRSSIVTRFHRA